MKLGRLICSILLILWSTVSRANIDIESTRKNILDIARKYLEKGTITYVYGGSEDDGLDCSHFIQKVFDDAKVTFPYINTALMLSLPPEKLKKNYGLIWLGQDLTQLQPTDFVIYRGHVVMVESISKTGWGDLIHATGGRDIKGIGQGVQRERNVSFATFRGPALGILRHKTLHTQSSQIDSHSKGRHPKMRKIAPRQK